MVSADDVAVGSVYEKQNMISFFRPLPSLRINWIPAPRISTMNERYSIHNTILHSPRINALRSINTYLFKEMDASPF